MNSINFARTCKQNNVYNLSIFGKNLNFTLFAGFQPIATVVRSSTTHLVKIRSKHLFSGKLYSFERFFSLEFIATLIKAGSESDNVLVRAPLLEPYLDTKTM